MKRRWHALCCAVVLLCGSASSATQVLPSSLLQMTQRSDAVVVGMITEGYSFWEADRIYTRYRLRADRHVKFPDASQPEWLDFRVMGGEVDGMRLEVDHAPSYEPGEEVLLFLVRRRGGFSVYGIYYGSYPIVVPGDGSEKQVRGPLFDIRETVDLDTRQFHLNELPPGGEPLERFIQRVQQLVEDR